MNIAWSLVFLIGFAAVIAYCWWSEGGKFK